MPPELTLITRSTQRCELLDQHPRREDVGGEAQLDAVGGALALVGHHAGVVDEHVEPVDLGSALSAATLLTSQAIPRASPPIARAASSARCWLRPTASTVAPSRAKPCPAASPIPDAAPVISTTCPSIRGGSAGQPGSRLRIASPTLP